MNASNNNIAGNDLVSRLLNVITDAATEAALAKVDGILYLTAQRIERLEKHVEELETLTEKRIGNLIERCDEIEEQSGADTSTGGLADRVRKLEEQMNETVYAEEFRDLERKVDDIDVEQTVTDAVNDLDLTREVRDVLLGMSEEHAQEFVSKGLSRIIAEANRI